MNYQEAMKHAKAGGKVKREAWSLLYIEWNEERKIFTIKSGNHRSHIYNPTGGEIAAKDWVEVP